MGSLENRLLREVAKIWFLLHDNVQNVPKILELQKLSEKSSKKTSNLKEKSIFGLAFGGTKSCT